MSTVIADSGSFATQASNVADICIDVMGLKWPRQAADGPIEVYDEITFDGKAVQTIKHFLW